MTDYKQALWILAFAGGSYALFYGVLYFTAKLWGAL